MSGPPTPQANPRAAANARAPNAPATPRRAAAARTAATWAGARDPATGVRRARIAPMSLATASDSAERAVSGPSGKRRGSIGARISRLGCGMARRASAGVRAPTLAATR